MTNYLYCVSHCASCIHSMYINMFTSHFISTIMEREREREQNAQRINKMYKCIFHIRLHFIWILISRQWLGVSGAFCIFQVSIIFILFLVLLCRLFLFQFVVVVVVFLSFFVTHPLFLCHPPSLIPVILLSIIRVVLILAYCFGWCVKQWTSALTVRGDVYEKLYNSNA